MGTTIHRQYLQLALCILVLHCEGVKGALGDAPFQLDGVGGYVGGCELTQAWLGWQVLLWECWGCNGDSRIQGTQGTSILYLLIHAPISLYVHPSI